MNRLQLNIQSGIWSAKHNAAHMHKKYTEPSGEEDSDSDSDDDDDEEEEQQMSKHKAKYQHWAKEHDQGQMPLNQHWFEKMEIGKDEGDDYQQQHWFSKLDDEDKLKFQHWKEQVLLESTSAKSNKNWLMNFALGVITGIVASLAVMFTNNWRKNQAVQRETVHDRFVPLTEAI